MSAKEKIEDVRHEMHEGMRVYVKFIASMI